MILVYMSMLYLDICNIDKAYIILRKDCFLSFFSLPCFRYFKIY